MSYSKTDGKMKEGHIHTNPDGSTWIIRNQEFVRTTGELKYVRGNHYECVDCHTTYSILEYYDEVSDDILSGIRCNEHTITLCPWCRPDSHPWMYGRGI